MTSVLDRPPTTEPTPRPARAPLVAGVRPAFRLAARDIRRAPGRSLLVVLLIALPIFALSAADVLTRTMQLSTSQQVNRQLGDAQAEITDPPAQESSPITQTPNGLTAGGILTAAPKGHRPAAITPAYLLARLPRGRLIKSVVAEWTITTRYGITTSSVDDTDYADPALAPLTRQVSGRAPTHPGEVALTPNLAAQIGRTVGQTIVDTSSKRRYTIVGLVKNRYDLTTQAAYVAPGTLTTADVLPGSSQRSYFLAASAPVTWPMILALNKVGVVVTSRYVAAHPPARADVPYYSSSSYAGTSSASGLTTLALLAGLVILEIVLLAGPAFTVGARRMRRTLGLIGAVGGSRHDLRNVVLAGGVILGFAAGVVGSAFGIAAGLALVPAYAHWQNAVAGPIDLRAVELLAIIGVSVGTGLLASWIPARQAARTDVLAALRGRRGTTRTSRITPLFGAIAAIGGAVLAIGGAAATGNQSVLLVGVIVAELGLIACTPVLIGWIGRAARWLPLSGRIALRDTVRNRSAATSAVAAIIAAVTGGVAVSILVASIDSRDRASYAQSLPMHYSYVDLSNGNLVGGTRVTDVVAALRRALPGRSVQAVTGLQESVAGNDVQASPRLRADPNGAVTGYARLSWPLVSVDDGRAIDDIAGRADPGAAAALRAGRAVVFNPLALTKGYLTVVVSTSTPSGNFTTRSRRVPAVLAASTFPRRDAVIPPSVAAAWGLRTAPAGVVVAGTTSPTSKQAQAAQAALSRLGIPGGLYVENGYQAQYRVGLIALLGASGFIALAAAMIATALAAVDSRPDLQTMAAIGASPRIRRRLSAARAGVIAGIGCVLGTACGFVAPIGYLEVQNALAAHNDDSSRYPITIPWWPNIAGVLILLPLLAAVGGLLFSRSRLPSERTHST